MPFILLAILAVFGVTPAMAKVEPQIFCDGQEELLQTYLETHKVLFMERDLDRVSEFYADEIISHNVDGGEAGARVVKTENLVRMWANSKKNQPNRRLDDELIFCIADFVIVRTILSGTVEGTILGQVPETKDYAITATDIYRYKDGKVIERWGNADTLSLFRQLGLSLDKLPPMEE